MTEERQKDDVLLRDKLTPEKRTQLATLTVQPGWIVLVELMEEACESSTRKVIAVNPANPLRRQLMDSLQAIAYAQNAFCRQVLDSCAWHTQSLQVETEQANLEQERLVAEALHRKIQS